MPIYEYRCRDCDHTFEELVLASADGVESAVACTTCESDDVEKLFSAFAVNQAPEAGPAPRGGRTGARSGRRAGRIAPREPGGGPARRAAAARRVIGLPRQQARRFGHLRPHPG